MFTGIVEETGTVRYCKPKDGGFELSIACKTVLDDVKLGDSIAVNGVCLTVTTFDSTGFTAGLAPETLSRTNLESLAPGSRTNLERSVLPTTRMGGHYVQGHIDTTGSISEFRKDADALWVTIKAPDSVMKHIVTKGYVTLDGTSLTVVDVGDNWFNVTLVAYTQQHIIMPDKSVGDKINIEVDVLGKYVERLLSWRDPEQSTTTSNITPNFLKENGYE